MEGLETSVSGADLEHVAVGFADFSYEGAVRVEADDFGWAGWDFIKKNR